MEDVYAAGIFRQSVRILFPWSPDNDQLGKYYENDAGIDGRISDSILVRLDKIWQGGIMQLYQACSISCQAILWWVIFGVRNVVNIHWYEKLFETKQWF